MRLGADAPAWLVARPIAHRGLHDLSKAVVENSVSAASAAIRHGFAIECDVQITADGEAVVFHDFTLERLTGRTGMVRDLPAETLASIGFATGGDRIATFARFLDVVDGRVPIVCEIKSRFDGDPRLADRVASLARAYAGPLAVKSFDPDVIAHLRGDPPCPLGIVAEADYGDPEWADLAPALRRDLAALGHFERTRPDFLSYHVGDLPHAAPNLCRTMLGRPVMTWTVRRPDQRDTARAWADQIVFEGFLP